MERLTKRTKDDIAYTEIPLNQSMVLDENGSVIECYTGFIAEKLANFEDLEEQGRLIKLPPIAEGDTLYWIWGDEIMPVKCRGIDRGVIYEMTTKEDRTFNKFVGTPFTYEKGDRRYFLSKNFGKTIFLTREEAEKALGGSDESL